MSQLPLFESSEKPWYLETFVDRVGEKLRIPEGINTISCTHGMHRFPGKFIPNIPRYLLRSALKHRAGRILLDPFCGSGTTLVEAALDGRPFVGVDIDPLAVVIATAKTEPLQEDDLDMLVRFWKNYDYSQRIPHLIPVVPNLPHWFSDKAVTELSAIKSGCMSLPPKPQLFCLVVFSSIIRRVSKADDQTQKTYVSRTLPKEPALASQLFPIFLERAIDGMKEYISLLPKPLRGHIIRADVRRLPRVEFDDVLTSPPYIDSIDYGYNQMLEYFWLLPELNVHNYDGYRSLRKEPMGFTYSSSENRDSIEERLLRSTRNHFESACRQIKKHSPKEENVVRTFFHDFTRHCEVMFKRQSRGAFYICVIGNSTIRQVTVQTAELMVDIFRSVGYKLEDRMVYEIRRHYMKFPRRSNSGKIKQDHILIFRR